MSLPDSPRARASASQSSGSGGAARELTVTSALKFDGKQAGWAAWKKKVLAWCQYAEIDAALSEQAPTTRAQARVAAAAAAAAGAGSASSQGPAAMAVDGNAGAQAASDAVADAEERAAWKKRAAKVYMALLMMLQGDELAQLTQHVPSGDAYGLWQTLCSKYERKTAANKMLVWTQLLRASLAPAPDTLDAYVSRLRSAQAQLTEMGVTVDADLLLNLLLKGLPDAWSVAVDTLSMKDSLKFDEAVEQLRDFQEKTQVNERAASAAGADTASFAREYGGGSQQRGRTQFQQQQRSGGAGSSHARGPASHAGGRNHGGSGGGNGAARLCYACDSPDHIAFDCPKNRNQKRCMSCRRLGHTDVQCPRGRGRNGRNAPSSGPAADADDETHLALDGGVSDSDDEYALMGGDGTGALCPLDWVLDSGASRHLSNTRTNMQNMQRLWPAHTVRVANGQRLDVQQQGEAQLYSGNNTPPSDFRTHFRDQN
jgi:hypothetical protein